MVVPRASIGPPTSLRAAGGQCGFPAQKAAAAGGFHGWCGWQAATGHRPITASGGLISRELVPGQAQDAPSVRAPPAGIRWRDRRARPVWSAPLSTRLRGPAQPASGALLLQQATDARACRPPHVRPPPPHSARLFLPATPTWHRMSRNWRVSTNYEQPTAPMYRFLRHGPSLRSVSKSPPVGEVVSNC
jgi:hypothetical protein